MRASSEPLTGSLGAPVKPSATPPAAGPAEAAVGRQLHGKCLYVSAGWWSYELCHGQHVRQFHVSEAHAVEQVITLGAHTLEGRLQGYGRDGTHRHTL